MLKGAVAARRSASPDHERPMDPTPDPRRKPTDAEVEVHGLTHPGRVRPDNQDHFLIGSIHKRIQLHATSLDAKQREFFGDERLAAIAMVADGVGGGQFGGEASATALETAMEFLSDSSACYYSGDPTQVDFVDTLQAAAMKAHEAILLRRAADGIHGTMATTLTLFMGVWPTYYILQLGDSRYYLWRQGVLTQLTRDQTMAQDLVDSGVLTRAAAVKTQFANVLSSALGADTAAPVVTRLESDWHNVHLLCSDGLTKHVTDERIGAVLGTMTSCKQAAEQLLQDALDGGGSDNVTIIVGRTVPKERAA
jgi:serine/threonine protein phosphatase PrpC